LSAAASSPVNNRQDAGRRPGGRGIDRIDLGMGMRRAQKIGVGLARQVDVVDIPPLAHDEPLVFLARHASADTGIGHDLDSSLLPCGRAYMRDAPA
jgi:hypothetical protein